MKKRTKEHLQKKGWNDKEIRKAEVLLEREEKHDPFLLKLVFWSALVVIIFANLIVSLILIPFLIVLNAGVLYLIIILLGGTIGFLYNFLITDMGHFGSKHHIAASIIIPLIAITNMILMVTLGNKFINNLKINNVEHNPWLIAIIFAVAFILPSLWQLRK
jgi:hypothetical protein